MPQVNCDLKKEIIITELNHCPILEGQSFYESFFGKIFPKYKKSKINNSITFQFEENKDSTFLDPSAGNGKGRLCTIRSKNHFSIGL